MFAKRFFYVCTGLLMLTIAYSIGANSVGAQASPGDFTGISSFPNEPTIAVTAGGDVYGRAAHPYSGGGELEWIPSQGGLANQGWQHMGNINGGTVAVDPATMGEVKAKFK